MEPRWLILVCALAAHALLALTFFPSFWKPFKVERRKWSSLVAQVLIPTSFGTVLAAQLWDHWQVLASPVLVFGGLGMGAATATVIIGFSKLRSFGT